SPRSTQSLCHTFLFNDSATTEIYTLSLHDALPIFGVKNIVIVGGGRAHKITDFLKENNIPVLVNLTHDLPQFDDDDYDLPYKLRSEEHTSELQSRENLVCRLLLEKKKKNTNKTPLL